MPAQGRATERTSAALTPTKHSPMRLHARASPAKMWSAATRLSVGGSESESSEGAFLGTALYMAPERLRGEVGLELRAC